MAFESNLEDFSLGDMFRLIEARAKSGTLHLTQADREGIVCFKSGRVFYASYGPQLEPAGERLVGAGIISEEQLKQAQGLMKTQIHDKADRKLGQVLVAEGFVDSSVLKNFVGAQLTGALFDLLRWSEGELRFEPDEHRDEVDLGLSVKIERVLADGQQRVDTWSDILGKIGTMDTLYTMSSGPKHSAADIRLKPREWTLLCHLHGGRSARQLSEVTGFDEFKTARVLSEMVAAGLIEHIDRVG